MLHYVLLFHLYTFTFVYIEICHFMHLLWMIKFFCICICKTLLLCFNWNIQSTNVSVVHCSSSFFFLTVSSFVIMTTLTLLAHAGLFWCFHSPPNSDMDYRILNVSVWSHARTHARTHTHTHNHHHHQQQQEEEDVGGGGGTYKTIPSTVGLTVEAS